MRARSSAGCKGAVGVRARFAKAILDLAGLHDGRFSRRFETDPLFDQSPDLIIMPRSVYRGMVRDIETHARFRSDYHDLSRSNPEVKTACDREKIGIAIRTGRPFSEELAAAVLEAARSANPPVSAENLRPPSTPLLGKAGGS